jgi:hypothetical protein
LNAASREGSPEQRAAMRSSIWERSIEMMEPPCHLDWMHALISGGKVWAEGRLHVIRAWMVPPSSPDASFEEEGTMNHTG